MPKNIRPMMEDDEEEVEYSRSSWGPNWAGPWHVAADAILQPNL